MKTLGILPKTDKCCSQVNALNELLTALKLNQIHKYSMAELLDGV